MEFYKTVLTLRILLVTFNKAYAETTIMPSLQMPATEASAMAKYTTAAVTSNMSSAMMSASQVANNNMSATMMAKSRSSMKVSSSMSVMQSSAAPSPQSTQMLWYSAASVKSPSVKMSSSIKPAPASSNVVKPSMTIIPGWTEFPDTCVTECCDSKTEWMNIKSFNVSRECTPAAYSNWCAADKNGKNLTITRNCGTDCSNKKCASVLIQVSMLAFILTVYTTFVNL